MPKNNGGRYTERTLGSKPEPKSDIPKNADAKTETVRATLKDNGFAKKYGPRVGP